MPKYKQGIFKPLNPQKYKGNPTNIVYRSGYELKLMQYLDRHPQILEWSSEETVIPYRSPIDNRMHRYFMDFKITKINTDGTQETILIEVKPKSQTQPPKLQTKATKRYLTEVRNWGINSAKWEAAEKYCIDRGWKFMIMHEDHLGIKR